VAGVTGGYDARPRNVPPGPRRATGETDPRAAFGEDFAVAEYALFIGWGSQRAGKELAAAKVFEEAVAYWNGLKTAGEIESFEFAELNAHGGDLSGFALLRGDPEKLGRLSMAPEFQRMTMRADVCLNGVGVVNAVVDAGMVRWMSAWKEAIADLI
jgi:hypothetical protein